MSGQDKLQELYNRTAYRSAAETAAERMSPDEEKRYEWFSENTTLDLPAASFFEIAPGSGTLFSFLKSLDVKRYLACDSNENVHKQFAKYFPNNNGVLIKNDALSALRDLKDKTFDCFVAFMVLEHLDNDYLTDLLSLIEKKLNPGGEMWIHVPCAESIVSAFDRYYDLTHKRSFTLNNFSTIAETYGLSIVAKSGKIVRINSIKSLVRYLHNKFVYLLNRFLFAFTIGVRKDLGVFSDELSIIIKKD